MSRNKLIYILPNNPKKKIDVVGMLKSLEERFEVLVLTDYESLPIEEGKNLNFFKNWVKDCKSEDVRAPFAIAGIDRFSFDYSNLDTRSLNVDVNYYCNLRLFVKKHIAGFQPDFMVCQVADNPLSLIASFLADEFNIPQFAELVRPYWPTTQILVHPRTYDNSQLKSFAHSYCSFPETDNAFSDVAYDNSSPKWSEGFISKPKLDVTKINSLVKLSQYYGVSFFLRYLTSRLWESYLGMNTDVSEQYLFFPLHLQPEAVFLGTDNRYADQAAFIEYLSYNLPFSYKLVVKEHPAQKLRPTRFYKKIAKLHNVLFCSAQVDVSTLITKSSGVIVISGNAGFEALKLGKKVLIFGQAFFSDFPNAFIVNHNQQLAEQLLDYVSAESFPVKDVEQYLKKFSAAMKSLGVDISDKDLLEGAELTSGERLNKLIGLFMANRSEFGAKI